ncbi:V4R domain protein [Planctomycetes bacterium Poly30]|uniref:V4R domain protein n=1 Tax=Saltatorellus ferox TaxID=2528018 RepID=A0A518EKN8_9BACT|nr:V4R domain protein [Planctomycetes bacterium Poly30]
MALIKSQAADGVTRDHVRCVEGEQPFVHNYFIKDRFFEHDRQEGVLVDRYGKRILRVSEDFIVGMAKGLEAEVGEQSAGDVMYKAGYRWGMKDQRFLDKRMTHEFECDFSKMGIGFVLESWWWPYTMGGWGTWRYDFTQGKQGLIFVDLYESAVAKSLGDIGKVACHFYAGLFGATFAGLAKRDLGSIEIQCYGMGDDFCRFLIASPKRVDAAAFWRNEGATSKDIQRKVKDV